MTQNERQALVGQFGEIPEYLLGLEFFTVRALLGYHRLHGSPGSFLHRCLANDFVGAALRADDTNRQNLQRIATYIHEELPHAAYGSDENVADWLRGGE